MKKLPIICLYLAAALRAFCVAPPSVNINGFAFNPTPQFLYGIGPGNTAIPLQVDASGNLLTAPSGSTLHNLTPVGSPPSVTLGGYTFNPLPYFLIGLNPTQIPTPLQTDVNGNLLVSGTSTPPTVSAYSVYGNNTNASAPGTSLQTITLGTPAITDTGVITQFTANANSFAQSIWQNTNAGATASIDLVLNNDVGTATTHYLDIGKNSSGFSGAGPTNIANGSYIYEQTDQLSLGTVGAQTLHLFTNNTDVITVAGDGTGLTVINTNGSALAAPATGTKLQIASADGDNPRLYLDSFAGNGTITFRRADTSNAGRSALQTSDTIGNLVALGYGATGYSSSSRASLSFTASQIWTDSNQGTQFNVFTTPNNSTTQGQALIVTQAKNTLLGGLTTDGTGTLQFPAATTNAGGITFGTDVTFFRTAAGAQTLTAALTLTPAARTTGASSYFTLNAPADTGITTATESIGVNHVGATRTWVDGTVAVQRENLFQAPTYNKTTTSATFTKAATLAVSAAPVAGSGVTITSPYALWVQAGTAQFDGTVTITDQNLTRPSSTLLQTNNNFAAAGGTFVGSSNTVLSSSASGSIAFRPQGAGGGTTTGQSVIDGNGAWAITPAARATPSVPYFSLTIPADTAATAATESIGYQHATGTRTWATTGTVALQRENYFAGPTYASAGASQTFTDAFTMYIDKPIAGSNAVFTRAHSLGIVDSTSAASSITGGLVVATTLGTSATSVGIGGGNVNAGGLITGGTVTSTGALTAGATSITGAAGTTALTIAQTARTSGILPYIKYTIPTDTAQTASTESPGIQGVTGTRTWATTGTVALQREIFFPGPTYASASASQTFTEAFNMYLTPPVAGSNAIFTRGHTLGIVDATSSTTAITGGVVVATTLGTPATSVGIGGGNITAGGAILASTSTGRVGYLAGSGVGTAVSQGTSRTTAVTSNTPTGQITLFTAAGSATAATFTVNCTAIAAGDTVQYAVSSGGTNLYEFFTTAISAGTSFNVTFLTTGGTASDAPVVNYTILKGSSN